MIDDGTQQIPPRELRTGVPQDGAASEPAWYVVSTKPRREDFAAAQIAQRRIDVFLPRIVLVRRGGERVVRPLFPGYLFAHLVLAREGSSVTWTPGVRRLVSFEGEPPPVPEAAIDFLRRQAGADGVIAVRPRPLPIGRRVRVTTGPLAGLVGIIDNPPDARGRVGVLMELLRRPMRVSVDVDTLEEA
jgi:transcriptional antiterminator RfaH